MGAAPITLINGDTLIDLLIQHEIGVKKKTLDYYELDESALQEEAPDEIDEAEGFGSEVD
jgi:restriction system protein